MIGTAISVRQYLRFLVVGGSVGLLTLGAREVVGLGLGTDTRQHYSISVVLAYALGMGCSFLLNHRFTFGGRAGSRSWPSFARFIGIALVGMLLTWVLSFALRYGLRLDALIGDFARTAALAAATLLSSGATYPLNAWLVFGGQSKEECG
jgi:putative flippase GtrA